jgi:hypothetical protein
MQIEEILEEIDDVSGKYAFTDYNYSIFIYICQDLIENAIACEVAFNDTKYVCPVLTFVD